jgi:protein TonB
MSVAREKRLKISPYWWWLLVALLFHATLFFGLNSKLVQPAQFDVSSGENAMDVSLEASEEPPSPPATPPPLPLPIPPSQPTPAPLPVEQPVPPKPDDVVVPIVSKAIPFPIFTPTPLPPTATPKHSESIPSSPPTHPPSAHHDITHTTEHHEALPGGEKGSAGNGKASYLENPEPPYPEAARDAQIEGRVELMVSVNATGIVTNVRLVRTSGEPSLDQSALQTVRTRWKFRPARAAGIPVSSQVLVPITFRLSE